MVSVWCSVGLCIVLVLLVWFGCVAFVFVACFCWLRVCFSCWYMLDLAFGLGVFRMWCVVIVVVVLVVCLLVVLFVLL